MSGKQRRCWIIKRKFLRVPSSAQPWTTQCLALLQHLSPGETLSERTCKTFVVWVNHITLDIMNVPLLDGLQAAGVPKDWGLFNSSVTKSRRKQPCGIGNQEFCCFFFFIMACVINLQRVPNSTNTVRLVTASRFVYGLVNFTHK